MRLHDGVCVCTLCLCMHVVRVHGVCVCVHGVCVCLFSLRVHVVCM